MATLWRCPYSARPRTRPCLAEIQSFYSHPDSWGSGVAAVLMAETLHCVQTDGFTQAHLWTLRDTPQSRRFHSQCGFTECGTARTFDFGDGNPLTKSSTSERVDTHRGTFTLSLSPPG
ncbi:GNAT family N-acetyltransferase [Streptomyces sp. NPDC046316]|uniref:GNAT family N-acetyltransferase n=1 Tax=Streptomyces sp. NPDC046316 TaxID=3154494 RepID=UPI0033CF64E6